MATNPKKKPSISKLKKKQYQEGATLTLQNAENLFEIAKSCHEKGFHGNGASILITALEELSKATYLQIKAHDPHIVITDLESYFYKHTIKHKAIMRLSLKSVLNEIITSIKSKEHLLAIGIIAVVISCLIVDSKMSIHDIEKTRQSGYYVNFVQSEKCWETPMDLISGDDFSEWLNLADSLFRNIKNEVFSNDLTETHIRQFIENLGDEDVYFRD